VQGYRSQLTRGEEVVDPATWAGSLLQILSDHPRLYWTRHSTPGRDWFRVQKPVPTDPLWTAKNDSISLPGQVGLPGVWSSPVFVDV
jgi:hypothetical protein